MSSSPEDTEKRSPQSSGTLETEPSEKDNLVVTTEEIGNQKLCEKVVQIKLDSKNSDVHEEAEIKQNNSVKQSGDVSNGEAASKPKTVDVKTSGLKAEPEEGSFGQGTQIMKSYEHKEKESYHVVFVPEIYSSAEGMPSGTKYVLVVIQQDRPEDSKKWDSLKSFNSKEMNECVHNVLDMWSKDKPEGGDQTRVLKSSGHAFPSRPVPDTPCSELEAAVRTYVTSLFVGSETIQFPDVVDRDRPPSGSCPESDTASSSDSEKDLLEASSREDEESARMRLVDISNSISREQESILFGRNENVKALEVSALDFTAERVEPCIIVLSDKFRISFDVSRFNKESISCRVVGNKIDVYALETRQNDYGYEMHEVHQIFKIPLHVDKDKFTASVKNNLLFMEAPLEIGI